MKKSIFFGIMLIGLGILATAGFVGARLLLKTQPGIENVFSIIWTVVLGVILYRLMLYIRPSEDAGQRAWRQNVYGGLLFILELFSVLVLIVCAIMLSTTLTSTTSQSGLSLVISVVGFFALCIPVGIRLLRLVSRRPDMAQNPLRIDGK